MSKVQHLSRRERQIMDVLYEQGEATAQQVMENLPDAPGYSAVRALLRKLEDKGHIDHREEALKYVYFPLVDTQEASRNAIVRLVRTFFEGSTGRAANALLGMSMQNLTAEELDALEARIKEARIKEAREKEVRGKETREKENPGKSPTKQERRRKDAGKKAGKNKPE